MRLVIIESPYKGDVWRNKRYLQACIRDCLRRGESPYASHQMLTDALDDNDPEQRDLGISAGLAWRHARQAIPDNEDDPITSGTLRHDLILPVFYVDLGISSGMNRAMNAYVTDGIPFERRTLSPDDTFFVPEEKLCDLCVDKLNEPHIEPDGTTRWRRCTNVATHVTYDNSGRPLRVCEAHFKAGSQ